MSIEVTLRFYAELRDFLDDPSGSVVRCFDVAPSVKDVIEGCGVPHTEVDLILADGRSVCFSHRVAPGERISVYPMFEAFDVASVSRVRPRPLRRLAFVLDVHLGKLARYLRLLGFDTDYEPERDDADLVTISRRERRVLLTRDIELLKHSALTHASFVRATDPRCQLLEVVGRFHLTGAMQPFSRCMACNGLIRGANRDEVRPLVPPAVGREQRDFRRCLGCGRVYWRGSHVEELEQIVEEARRL